MVATTQLIIIYVRFACPELYEPKQLRRLVFFIRLNVVLLSALFSAVVPIPNADSTFTYDNTSGPSVRLRLIARGAARVHQIINLAKIVH